MRARLGTGEARALPDAELVAAMRGGEPAAFAEFHARFRPLLLRQARRLRIRQAWWPDCVDDVLEDAALRLIAEAAPLPRSLAGYLARAARNRFLNMSRDDAGRMRRHAAVAEAPDHPAERVVRSLCSESAKRASGDPWTPPVLDSALSRLGELLTRDLTEEEQQLLAWVAEGVEHRQIAAWLGNSYAATTKRIWRVCARLRELAPGLRGGDAGDRPGRRRTILPPTRAHARRTPCSHSGHTGARHMTRRRSRHDASRHARELPIDEKDIARLVGRAVLRYPHAPAWSGEPFLEWLAATSRDAASRPGGADRAPMAAGEAFMARVQARALGIVRCADAPPCIAPLTPGAPGAVLAAAAAVGAAPMVALGVAAGVGRELWEEPVESWVVVPTGFEGGTYVTLRISGDSMLPVLHDGDTVLVRVGDQPRRDTVIIARHPDDGYVCKKVGRIGRSTIELHSLAPDRPVIVIPRDPTLVVGTVLLVWCSHPR